jgi:hypothetical protein
LFQWDEDKSSELEKDEVVRALIKTFGISTNLERLRELRETVDAVWSIFDHDGSGSLSLQEACAQDGLLDSLLASLAQTGGGAA